MQTPSAVNFDCPAAGELAQDRGWWDIYREAFPAYERDPVEVILDTLQKRVGLAFRLRQDGATIGLAATHLLLNPPAVFLVYIALDRRHRGAGYGGALFEHVSRESTDCLRQRGLEPLGVVWEVADPKLAAPPERFARERRIAFFLRHGGVVLPRRYFQPPLERTVPVEMLLMCRTSGGAPMPDTGTVEALVRAMYLEKYDAINNIPTKILQDLLRQAPL
jgi:GNAT superfamily N-acetyltransferase